MTPAFSLAHLTVLDLPPPEMVQVAARTGYTFVGLASDRRDGHHARATR